MRLLLDTSVFLWYVTADSKLPASVVKKIRLPDNDVWLSVVSFWEILVKHQLGKLPLPQAPFTYIPKQRERHTIDSLDLGEKAVAHLSKLPMLHRDPFDRMLVCQAIEHDLSFVTSDELVQSYPVKTLWG